METGKKTSTLSYDRQYALQRAIALLEEERTVLIQQSPEDIKSAFQLLKAHFDKQTKALKQRAEDAGRKLSNVFQFVEEVFQEGQELLILVTELTISHYGAYFISRYGCKEYFAHNKELLFYERQKEIIHEIENLDL